LSSLCFDRSLEFGQAGESSIARWMRSRGHTLLPAYEKIIDTGKGPRVFGPKGAIVSPDFLVWKGDKAFWLEAKRKTGFTWHRLTNRWVTGIDLRHYEDYLKIQGVSPWPVWLLFLQEGGPAKDSPEVSPSGLYGRPLTYLKDHENHRHQNWGRSGMVYWAANDLQLIAPLSDLEVAA
jgi:hypothetical protein